MVLFSLVVFAKITVFVKLIGTNVGNYPYKLGLNTLKENGGTFDPSPTYGPGGLYYTDTEHVFDYVYYGTTLCVVHPAEDTLVVEVDSTYKTDRLVIEKMMPIWEVDTLVYLIEHGADVHANNNAALRWSATYGYLEVVRLLLEHGADVHAYDDYALRYSAKYGHVEVVRLLLEHGADVHAWDDDALCWSATYGHPDVVRLLLEHGADVHAEDDLALSWSARYDHVEMVKLLLEHGANVHAALLWSVWEGHVEVAKLLLEYGADVHANDDEALRESVERGHVDVARLLLRYGADKAVLGDYVAVKYTVMDVIDKLSCAYTTLTSWVMGTISYLFVHANV